MEQGFLTEGLGKSMSALYVVSGNIDDVEAELAKGPTRGLENHTRLRPKHLFSAVMSMEASTVKNRGLNALNLASVHHWGYARTVGAALYCMLCDGRMYQNTLSLLREENWPT